jgi:hypothetical protein
MTSRTALVAGLAAAALSLAGCGGDSGTAATGSPAAASRPPAAPAPTPAPTPAATMQSPAALTSPPAPVAGEPGLLPAGFPVPPGTKVGTVSVAGGEITAALTVTDGKTSYAFWRSHLPAAGFRITGAQMVGGIGEISFTGRDCAGRSQLGINDDSVTLECKRG